MIMLAKRDLDPGDPRHGTTAGYYAHRYRGHEACRKCVRALREDRRNRRHISAEARAIAQWRADINNRALGQLSRLHRDELRKLAEAEARRRPFRSTEAA